jgi:hypothetical protein
MVRAIARCAFDSPSYHLPDTSICITLQEACSSIENNPDLHALKDVLISEIYTYFYCCSCHKVSDSLMSSNNQIFIFKLTVNGELVAHPIVSKNNEDFINDETSCTHCKYSIKNINLPVYKQVFYKCPAVLLVSFTIIITSNFGKHQFCRLQKISIPNLSIKFVEKNFSIRQI